jgi:uncharacterized protein (TIGR02452 family)
MRTSLLVLLLFTIFFLLSQAAFSGKREKENRINLPEGAVKYARNYSDTPSGIGHEVREEQVASARVPKRSRRRDRLKNQEKNSIKTEENSEKKNKQLPQSLDDVKQDKKSALRQEHAAHLKRLGRLTGGIFAILVLLLVCIFCGNPANYLFAPLPSIQPPVPPGPLMDLHMSAIQRKALVTFETNRYVLAMQLRPLAERQVAVGEYSALLNTVPPLHVNGFEGKCNNRIRILQKTFTALRTLQYNAPNGHIVSLAELPPLRTKPFVCLNPCPVYPDSVAAGGHTEVGVLTLDTFEAAYLYKSLYADERVAVLNFANAIRPGGGVLGGCAAQEEELCRRSNLYLALHSVAATYPLEHTKTSRFQGLYTEDVSVLREVSYSFLPAPFQTDVITLAAIDLNGDLAFGQSEAFSKITAARIEAGFQVAAEHGVKTLVLGAFGCGVFRNPPEIIARLYMQILTTKFPRTFSRVIFAIIMKNDLIQTFTREISANLGALFIPLKTSVPAYDFLLARLISKANLSCLRVHEGGRVLFLQEALDAFVTLCPPERLSNPFRLSYQKYKANGDLYQACYTALGIAISEVATLAPYDSHF